jgi:D-serine deaminase-like pyridoxal phosphate-dependent protein
MLTLGGEDQSLEIGEKLRFVPNHACTVSNLADVLLGVRKDRVTDILPVLVRGGGR